VARFALGCRPRRFLLFAGVAIFIVRVPRRPNFPLVTSRILIRRAAFGNVFRIPRLSPSICSFFGCFLLFPSAGERSSTSCSRFYKAFLRRSGVITSEAVEVVSTSFGNQVLCRFIITDTTWEASIMLCVRTVAEHVVAPAMVL